MADDKTKGAVVGGVSGLSVLIGLAVLFSVWLANHDPNAVKNRPQTIRGNTSSQSRLTQTQKSNTYIDKATGKEKVYSPYHGQINLGPGTAASTYQPGQEYVTISAHGNKEPINIGGWILKNGWDKHLFVASKSTIKTSAVSVTIPSQGVALYDPYHPLTNKSGPIKLKSGERAIITTGRPSTLSGVKIKDNFKLNWCLGYLEDEPGDRAYPSLKYRCPSSNDVTGISYLDTACYNFVRSIRPCHTPKDIYVKSEDDYCLDRNCKLTSYCRNFVKENYNFDSCFARYSAEEDFVGNEWRVFLNQSWELWLDRRETISLYDRAGLLVAEVSY